MPVPLRPWPLEEYSALLAPTAPRPSLLEKPSAVPADAWIPGDLELFTGKTLLPPRGSEESSSVHPIGRLKPDQGSANLHGPYIFDPTRQLPTLRRTAWEEGPDPLLLYQEGKVRRILPFEIWCPQGGTNPGWQASIRDGHAPTELALWALRAPTPVAAGLGAAWCAATLRCGDTPTDFDHRAGVCPFPDEEAWLALKGWLAVQSIADGVRRVGGPRRRHFPPYEQISRQLSHILRHLVGSDDPIVANLQYDMEGRVWVDDLTRRLRGNREPLVQANLATIQDIVREGQEAGNRDNRFEMGEEDGRWWIKAHHGHSAPGVVAGVRVNVQLTWCFHAARLGSLRSIFAGGSARRLRAPPLAAEEDGSTCTWGPVPIPGCRPLPSIRTRARSWRAAGTS